MKEAVGGGQEAAGHCVVKGHGRLYQNQPAVHHRWAERPTLQVLDQDGAEDGGQGLTVGAAQSKH